MPRPPPAPERASGGGLDVSGPRSNTSYGLIGMKERAESLGGEFRLDSEPGRGTSVEVLLQGARRSVW